MVKLPERNSQTGSAPQPKIQKDQSLERNLPKHNPNPQAEGLSASEAPETTYHRVRGLSLRLLSASWAMHPAWLLPIMANGQALLGSFSAYALVLRFKQLHESTIRANSIASPTDSYGVWIQLPMAQFFRAFGRKL